MKKVFARTTNVNAFVAAMSRLLGRGDGIPGMALIYSEPGLGKTRTAMWWCAQNDGVFIRTKKLMKGRWLLEEIVAELGEEPMRRTADLFRQTCSQLIERPRAMFFDEMDRFALTPDIIETLRDIHDVTNSPIIFIGMGGADGKFAPHKHLYSRFSEILKFQDFSQEDVTSMAEQLCDIKLSGDAITFIHNNSRKNLRLIRVWLYKAEAIARANSLKEVTAAHLNGVKK